MPDKFLGIHVLEIVLNLTNLGLHFLRYHILALPPIRIHSYLGRRIFAIILLYEEIRVLIGIRSAITVPAVELLVLVHKRLALVLHVVFEKPVSSE